MGVQQFLPAFGYINDHDVAPVQQGMLSMSLLQAAVQQRRSISSLRLGPNAPTAGHTLWGATNPAPARMGVQQFPPAFGGNAVDHAAPLQEGTWLAQLQGGPNAPTAGHAPCDATNPAQARMGMQQFQPALGGYNEHHVAALQQKTSMALFQSAVQQATSMALIQLMSNAPTAVHAPWDATNPAPARMGVQQIPPSFGGSNDFYGASLQQGNSMAFFQGGSSAPTAGQASSGTGTSAQRTGFSAESASITASGSAASRASSGPTRARRPFESTTGSTLGTTSGRTVGAPKASGQESTTPSQRAWYANSTGTYSVVHPARTVQIHELAGAHRVPVPRPFQQPADTLYEAAIGQFPFGASTVPQRRRVLAARTNTPNTYVLADCAPPPFGVWECPCCRGKTPKMIYKGADGSMKTLVFITKNVESSVLTDHYDLETLYTLLEDVDRAKGDDDVNEAQDKVKAFTTRTFSRLLGDGRMIFMNEYACHLPLVPRTLEERLAKEKNGHLANDALANDACYKTYQGRVRFILGGMTGTKGGKFSLTVWACRVCRRYYRVSWNGKFEPVIDKSLYALPDLGPLSHTLLTAVERDDFFDEQFAPLPGEITLSVATSILKLAAVVFRRDGAHTELIAPVKVLGDVHGQITTVRKAYSILTDPTVRRGTGCSQFCLTIVALTSPRLLSTQVPLMMMGDTCDRGPNSLFVDLFAAIKKLSDPPSICVLRGNHETRKVNGDKKAQGMTLKRECRIRFEDEEEAFQLWEAMNVLFDNLPYGATINHRDDPNAKPLICVHGGPVPSFLSLETWNYIDRAYRTREKRLHAAMWADPNEDPSYEEDFQDTDRTQGTQLMSESVFDRCLKANKAQRMVRAHGEAPGGFKEMFGGKVVTVTSNHEGGEVGCLLEVNYDLTLHPYTFSD
jgi:Calcineurin-like phosphoesterase